MQRAARRANGPQPLAARVRHTAHHAPANGRRSVVSGRHCGANAATGCNGLWSVATDGTALQPVALLVCCSGSHCVAIIAATGCNGLWSIAMGCGLLQRIALCCNHRCNRWQLAVVCCNGPWSVATGDKALRSLHRLQRAVAHGSELWSVATGCAVLHRAGLLKHSLNSAAADCNGLWSIATDRTALQSLQQVARAVVRCN